MSCKLKIHFRHPPRLIQPQQQSVMFRECVRHKIMNHASNKLHSNQNYPLTSSKNWNVWSRAMPHDDMLLIGRLEFGGYDSVSRNGQPVR